MTYAGSARFTPREMRCGSCGWENPAEIAFCTNCGRRVAAGKAGPGADARPPPSAFVVTPGGGSNGRFETPQLTALGSEDISCPSCGASGSPDRRFCRLCGTALSREQPEPENPGEASPAQVSCPQCAKPGPAGAAFCRHCGVALGGAAYASPGLMGLSLASQRPRDELGPRLVILLKDGSEGQSIALSDSDADVGASEGDITLPDDPYLSPRHARILCRDGTYIVRDLSSENGIYVRLREDAQLRDRDMLLVGQQVLRFEQLSEGESSLGPAHQGGVMVFGTPEAPRLARLLQYTTEGVARDVHYLFRDETIIGRENGDIVFTDDPFLSRRHAAVRFDRARRCFSLHDLGSSNGTALRIRGEHVLSDGDQFRIGRHLFRFEAKMMGGRGER